MHVKSHSGLKYSIIAVFAAVFIWAEVSVGPKPIDDAYIIAAHGQNFAEHDRIVFDHRSTTNAATSQLWAFLIGVSAKVLNVNVVQVAFYLEIFFVIMSIFLISRLYKPAPLYAYIPILALFINMSMNTLMVGSGMETSCYVFFVTLFFLLLHNEKIKPAILLACFSVFIRVEAPVILLATGIFWIIVNQNYGQKRKAEALLFLILSMVIIIVFMMMMKLTTGHIVPHSMVAKSTFSRTGSIGNIFIIIREMFSTRSVLIFMPFFLFGAIKVVFGHRHRLLISSLLIYVFCYIIFYALAGYPIMPFVWYRWHIFLGLFLIAGFGLTDFLGWLSGLPGKNAHYTKAFILGISICFFAIATLRFLTKQDEVDHSRLDRERLYEHYGALISDHYSEDTVILASEVGALGYYTNSYIIDIYGLISPEVIDLYKKNSLNTTHAASLAQRTKVLLDAFDPDFIFIAGPEDLDLDNMRLKTLYKRFNIYSKIIFCKKPIADENLIDFTNYSQIR